ncbi:hypothetical protein SAMN05216266_108233 [Amycolatopsis marina]|uniref:Peptidase inhibitor family I36 n=1 Tax=Amycolatopsis marina TaxID=490629 RepID=A0A1I1A6Q0_9PSEU|nr:hypothetical protein [Amycolatopsis marina]SFB33597.1 hypothetical protein SAMN05216266_108233 [Amycolatopsis marina]
MFSLHSKGKRLASFMASAILALGIVVGSGGMSTAGADTIRPYLGWSESGGYCYGTWSKYVGTRTYNPKTHSVTRLKRTETTSSSMTKIYNQNGVRKARVYEACRNGGLTRSFSPSVYKHRSIKVSYVCWSGRCSITSRIYGSWLNGTGTPK